jgi:SpoVK/Ycf46/Vps4 family AAA+-type ATPase
MPRNPSTRSIQQLAVMESYYMDYVNTQRYEQSYPDTLMSYMEFVHLANYHFDRYVRPVMGKVLTEPSAPTLAPYTAPTPTSAPQSKWVTLPRTPPPPPTPPAIKKLVIDGPITTLRDLIRILETHPYSPEVEANIDLKALHNIREELVEIDGMIGLATFKETLLDQLMYFMQNLHVNREHDYKHMVIYGPPGTGKTQVAKLVGTMYSKLGILSNGVFKKVTRNDLVAGYLGQTAIKTAKVVEDCLGGCLFIDEVYALGTGAQDGGKDGGDSFSKECVDTLCEALSNHKENLMVIVAGYEQDVNESFFKVNPGLPSRFIWRFTMDEYRPEELMRIFIQKVEYNQWSMGSIALPPLTEWFTKNKSHFPYFGRDMEQLFTYSKIAHGRRIFGKPSEERKIFTMVDIEQGFKLYMKHADTTKTEDRHKLSESCFGLYL